jgi:hypothetical protein
MSYNIRVKIKNIVLGLFLGLGLTLFVPQQAQAAKCANSYGIQHNIKDSYTQGEISSLNFSATNVISGRNYQLLIDPGAKVTHNVAIGSPVTARGGVVSFNTNDAYAVSNDGGKYKQVFLKFNDANSKSKTCLLAEYEIKVSGGCNITFSQAGSNNAQCLDVVNGPITVNIDNLYIAGKLHTGSIWIYTHVGGGSSFVSGTGYYDVQAINGHASQDVNPSSQFQNAFFEVRYMGGGTRAEEVCKKSNVKIQKECSDEQRTNFLDEGFEICNQVPESGPKQKCLDCFTKSGIWTAIGCIETSSTESIVGKLMTVGISIAGGIALLMILGAAFLFATSEGEPKRTSEAKEILTSAIVGLIFIIFSVTILQFIGVNILHIPGFGG